MLLVRKDSILEKMYLYLTSISQDRELDLRELDFSSLNNFIDSISIIFNDAGLVLNELDCIVNQYAEQFVGKNKDLYIERQMSCYNSLMKLLKKEFSQNNKIENYKDTPSYREYFSNLINKMLEKSTDTHYIECELNTIVFGECRRNSDFEIILKFDVFNKVLKESSISCKDILIKELNHIKSTYIEFLPYTISKNKYKYIKRQLEYYNIAI